MFKASLICTVLNEQETIGKFIDSVEKQSVLPSELIIVDGGSSDNTLSLIKKRIRNDSGKLKIRVFTKKGNRSIGRNEAIKKSSYDTILSSDSGCVLDKNWIYEITKPLRNKKVDIVAGYYKGLSINIFQKSLIPYVLVMSDNVNPNEFLPATRSMAFKKSIWKKVGGFDENLSNNEDYAFSIELKRIKANIGFSKDAIVYWLPRNNFLSVFRMFFRFALGDVQASIYREKVIYIFLRYIFAIYLLILSTIMKSSLLDIFIMISFVGYLCWSIWKNYKYVKNYKAFFYLPLLQFTSDFAVLIGTTLGLIQKIAIRHIFSVILKNKGVFLVILIYILSMLSVISYGIPNPSHPFNYFMDEWHQSQSVRNLFTLGTPNVEGSANGSIFQFFLTGIYLIPFQVLGLIDVFAIKSSVTNLDLQFRLFEILRLNTILFGIGSITIFSYIAKKYFRLNVVVAAFLFTFNPLWLMLSNYFKYDIALMFWILASFLFFLRYAQNPNFINFLWGGIFTGLALSTKLLTPLPLVAVYITTFFIFTSLSKEKIKNLVIGIITCLLVYAFFGNPDIILDKGSLYDYLYSNLILAPKTSENLILGMGLWSYLLTKLYPATFGKFLYLTFAFSLLTGLILIVKSFLKYPNTSFFSNLVSFLRNNKSNTILVLSFIFFAISLFAAGIQAVSNRLIVLLPFMVLLSALFINRIYLRIKNQIVKSSVLLILILLFSFQFIESYSWLPIKWSSDPRQSSSLWIQRNIPEGSLIGIENIPIYQSLPDIIVKEFYLKQYNQKSNFYFKYKIINSKTDVLPNIIIISDDEIEKKYIKVSEKNNLTKRLNKENYKKIMVFKPDFKYFKVFNSELEYVRSALVQAPDTITVYEKL